MLGQPLNSVEGTEFVLATLPATQCDHQGQKPKCDRSWSIHKNEEGVGMCASDSNSLSSLQSTMARLIPCKQNSWPGQVKISKNIINVGEKYHPHMAIIPPIWPFSMNKATTTPGFLGVYFSFLWGRDSWRYPAVTSFLRSSEFCAIKAWFSERSSAFKALCRKPETNLGSERVVEPLAAYYFKGS